VRTAQADADDRLSSVAQWTSSLRRSRLLGRTWVVTALAGALYLAFAIAVTWPLGLHPRSSIYGPLGSDLTGSIGRFQEFVAADQLPFLPGRMSGVDAPEGLTTTWALDVAAFPNIAVHWALSVAFGAIAANGLLALAAFTLCALSMFLLTRWLTGHAGAALIAGLAFGFWPWVFSTATQALGHGWVFVVLLWRALVALEHPTLRNGVLVGLAAALCMTWFQYWILIGGVFYATLAVTVLLLAFARGEGRSQLRTQLSGFVVVAALGVFLTVLAGAASPGEIPSRPESDAYSYSARLWMYLLPHPENPLLGSWSRSIADHRYAGFTPDTPAYANIYLGWTMLLLAFVGVGSLVHALLRDPKRALRERGVAAAFAAAAAALLALLFSGPPRVSILGQEIPTPEEIVLRATTAFRVTHRFALVVMLGVCVLAALGLRTLLAGRSATVVTIVVAVLAIAVPLDLWGRQVDGARRVDYPRLYSELKREPPGIVAVYPLGPDSDNLAIFYRPSHGKPVLNGHRTGSETHPLKGDLQALADPGTVPQLAALGVRYVVVREGAASQPWHPRPGQRFRGLRVIQRTRDGTSFRVVANPAPAIVSFGPGFYGSERTSQQFMRWMAGPRARIDVRGDCDPCVGRVRLRAASFARTRVLVVRDEGGANRALAYVRTEPTTVSFRARFRRRASFFLSTRPGPESIAAATGGSDPRVVSIQVASPMTFVRDRR
jgi:hypothetical protein